MCEISAWIVTKETGVWKPKEVQGFLDAKPNGRPDVTGYLTVNGKRYKPWEWTNGRLVAGWIAEDRNAGTAFDSEKKE